ncbi:MAG TPA: hypothetical protein P5080_04855 [Candidatus Paceibacterota bacterium]|nr:hypothetical protein [Candidatus Pacearchaeota archaeon]HRZ51281.1 hypothetical protein [Candidatus Paceibacterota bacterium]HSA37003.1 hypothetical protein [Candidatus Paceibacterota bacterium]
MKITIKGPLKDNINNLARKLGYQFQRAKKDENGIDELEFSRVMSASGYPRFHLFLKSEGENLVFTLHLDQKKPSYSGSSAHAGEYSGTIVEEEAKRIRTLMEGT